MSRTAVVLRMPQILGVDPDPGGEAWNDFIDGWASFTDWQVILPLVVNVLLAVLLMLPFVYGQRSLGRFHSLARIREQKALDQFTVVLLVPRGVALPEMNESLNHKISDELKGKIQVNLGD